MKQVQLQHLRAHVTECPYNPQTHAIHTTTSYYYSQYCLYRLAYGITIQAAW